MGCNGQPLWLPGGSWNLGGFEHALDQLTMRLSGTNSECLFRARRAANWTSLARVCVHQPLQNNADSATRHGASR
jgi:hypothetical protein